MKKEVYGRAIILRNCGRFLNIASDFGSEYKTHPFLTEQMVYAGMTREKDVEKGQVPEKYDFESRYNIPNNKYFTCGYIIDKEKYEANSSIQLWNKNRDNSDINDFNSIDETEAGVQTNKKLPKYGNIECILPNNYFLTFAFSTNKNFLKEYYAGQTFYMGKKRTMFQIEDLSQIDKNKISNEETELFLPIQVDNKEIEQFNYYEIVTVTQRYVLVKGKTKIQDNYKWGLDFNGLKKINLPSFFVNKYLE